MWIVSTMALLGAMVGMGAIMVHVPESQSFLFPTISVTAGLFIFCFTNAILLKK